MRRKPRPPAKSRKPVAHKSSLVLDYRTCRRCGKKTIFLNGRCSACA
jgi:hypothetical protein